MTVAAGERERSAVDAKRRRSLPWLLLLGLVLLAWLLWALPLALGERTLYLRDVLATHLPYKSVGAEYLRRGEIPTFNPAWALGQPFRGNPNALPFYPGNLLYLLLPFSSAFNLHYALHLLLGFMGMAALARRLGLGREASILAGIVYSTCGWYLSGLTFYNLLTVAAWWPLVLLGVARGGRRGIAIGGLALGMALLGGEPLTAALGAIPVLWLAVSRLGWRRGLSSATAVGVIGVLMASPQLVATWRVLEFTVRGGPGLPIGQAGARAFHPLRLLELVMPFPLGRPGELGPLGFWTLPTMPQLPYFLTMYFGVVGLWLALRGGHRAPGWSTLALSGLIVAWLGGYWPGLVSQLSGGLFRYPEKALLWLTLAVPVLAGLGLDELLGVRRRRILAPWIMGAALGVVAVLLAWSRPSILAATARGVELSQSSSDPQGLGRALASVEAHLDQWLIALGLGCGLLLLAGWCARRRHGALLVALQLVTLFQLWPLLQTIPVSSLRQGSRWLEMVGTGASVYNDVFTAFSWHEPPVYDVERLSAATMAVVRSQDLDSSFGVAAGLSYPLAGDLEGIYSPLHAQLIQLLETADWPSRVNWLRALGVEYAVFSQDPRQEALQRIDSVERFGVETGLYRVAESAPLAWWPLAVETAPLPSAQLAAVGRSQDPLARVTVPAAVPHLAGAELEILETAADRWRLRVRGGGGVLALRRSYQPLLRARSSTQRLATLPVNYCLMGIVVPPGEHLVVLEVSNWPEIVAAILALLAAGATVWMGWRR